jgi:hypothetical protein
MDDGKHTPHVGIALATGSHALCAMTADEKRAEKEAIIVVDFMLSII